MITEVESIHGDPAGQRFIFYRCRVEATGEWRSYGPIITTDPDFDIEAGKAMAAEKVRAALQAQPREMPE